MFLARLSFICSYLVLSAFFFAWKMKGWHQSHCLCSSLDSSVGGRILVRHGMIGFCYVGLILSMAGTNTSDR